MDIHNRQGISLCFQISSLYQLKDDRTPVTCQKNEGGHEFSQGFSQQRW